MSPFSAEPMQLEFVTPPPGLAPLVDFTLAPIDSAPGLFSLTAKDGAARLFVLDAALHLPGYAPRIPSADLAAIGAGDGAAPMILVVVNPGAQSTANLSAPMVLNTASGACVQVILEGSDWPLRHPLAPAAS